MWKYLFTAIIMVSFWFIFRKMGRHGWEGIIPFYNIYVLCSEFYDKGWKALLFFVPLYNIYFAIKLNIDLADRFGQSAAFGIAMSLLPFICYPLLAFGKDEYIG